MDNNKLIKWGRVGDNGAASFEKDRQLNFFFNFLKVTVKFSGLMYDFDKRDQCIHRDNQKHCQSNVNHQQAEQLKRLNLRSPD